MLIPRIDEVLLPESPTAAISQEGYNAQIDELKLASREGMKGSLQWKLRARFYRD